MFYLNTIEQLFLFIEQLDQVEVCIAYSRLLAGIPILAVFQNLRCNSNKTSLYHFVDPILGYYDWNFHLDKNPFSYDMLIFKGHILL